MIQSKIIEVNIAHDEINNYFSDLRNFVSLAEGKAEIKEVTAQSGKMVLQNKKEYILRVASRNPVHIQSDSFSFFLKYKSNTHIYLEFKHASSIVEMFIGSTIKSLVDTIMDNYNNLDKTK